MQPVTYIGARIKNAGRFALARLHGSYSEFGQDRWVINDLFDGMHGGFFVEVGAYNGVVASNTCLLEREYARQVNTQVPCQNIRVFQ